MSKDWLSASSATMLLLMNGILIGFGREFASVSESLENY